MSAGWWFVACFLTGGIGTAVLLAIGNSDGRSRFGRWWAGTPKVVNPVGWDQQAQRCHDVSPQPGNSLLHYSTCWCRQPLTGGSTPESIKAAEHSDPESLDELDYDDPRVQAAARAAYRAGEAATRAARASTNDSAS